MIFNKTRKFLKMVNKTKKITKKLCESCEKKSVNEIILNKEENKPLNQDIWCEKCLPKIKELHSAFNPYSKNIVEDYEK